MKKFFTPLLLLMTLLYLFGCGVTKELKVEQKTEPTWFSNPPKNTQEYLYSVGSGRDKKSATTDALAQMIATLSVKVSSKFNARTVVNEGFISKKKSKYVSENTSEVQEIRIGNYEVVHSKKMSFRSYIVLVRSHKKKLFDSLKNEMEQIFLIIKEQEKNIGLKNSLKRVDFYKNVVKKLNYLENTLLVMRELNSTFKSEKYILQREMYKRKYDSIVRKISFSLSSSAAAHRIKQLVQKALSSKHFTIGKGAKREHLSISIYENTQYAHSYGFYLAKASLELVTKDYKGNAIASNHFNVTGQSSTSKKMADANVAEKFNKIIQEKGIFKVLNLTF